MLWNFQNLTLKFINGEWWQQKETNLQSNRSITFLFLIKQFQKQTNWTMKIDKKCKNQNWTQMQKPTEKKMKKTGASC